MHRRWQRRGRALLDFHTWCSKCLNVCTTIALFAKNIPTIANHRSSLLQLLTCKALGDWNQVETWTQSFFAREYPISFWKVDSFPKIKVSLKEVFTFTPGSDEVGPWASVQCAPNPPLLKGERFLVISFTSPPPGNFSADALAVMW